MKKIIMIGMNPRTRNLIPWDTDAEYWTLNEGHSKDWMKRFDVLFQIHPRWDWDRANNLAAPNHPLFVKTKAGECLYCKGNNKVYKDSKEYPCPWCKDGHFVIPPNRFQGDKVSGKPKRIIMQDDNEDVPGCIRYPIEKIKAAHPEGQHMLTSTLAHMLAYAIHYLPDHAIELYGFEAESNTEYAVQRPGITFWMGYGRGLGMSIEAPGSHLLTGKHYGYEDFDQGYRSRLELRRRVLQENLNSAEGEWIESEGRLKALTPLKNIKRVKPMWEAAYDDHDRKGKFVSLLRGTILEINKAIEILDSYRQDSDEATQADIRRLIEMPYQLG